MNGWENFQSVTTKFSSESRRNRNSLRSFRNRVVEKEDSTLIDST